MIEKYKTDFEYFQDLKSRKVKTKGRPVIEYWLNENQALLLCTYLRNSPIVRQFKIKLIEEFNKLKKQNNAFYQHKQQPEYQITRDAGKIVRKQATDTMQEFVEYAKEQGSQNAEKYYGNITRMMNGLLFIVEGKFKNLRSVMPIPQLMTCSSAERIIDRGLRDGMNKKKYYKDIYKEVRSKVEFFAELHGKSEIMSKQLQLEE